MNEQPDDQTPRQIRIGVIGHVGALILVPADITADILIREAAHKIARATGLDLFDCIAAIQKAIPPEGTIADLEIQIAQQVEFHLKEMVLPMCDVILDEPPTPVPATYHNRKKPLPARPYINKKKLWMAHRRR